MKGQNTNMMASAARAHKETTRLRKMDGRKMSNCMKSEHREGNCCTESFIAQPQKMRVALITVESTHIQERDSTKAPRGSSQGSSRKRERERKRGEQAF